MEATLKAGYHSHGYQWDQLLTKRITVSSAVFLAIWSRTCSLSIPGPNSNKVTLTPLAPLTPLTLVISTCSNCMSFPLIQMPPSHPSRNSSPSEQKLLAFCQGRDLRRPCLSCKRFRKAFHPRVQRWFHANFFLRPAPHNPGPQKWRCQIGPFVGHVMSWHFCVWSFSTLAIRAWWMFHFCGSWWTFINKNCSHHTVQLCSLTAEAYPFAKQKMQEKFRKSVEKWWTFSTVQVLNF